MLHATSVVCVFRSRPHFGYVVAALARSVPPHPFRGGHWLRVRVTNVTHLRNGSARAGVAVHSFFHTLMAASSTEALARIFMAAVTAWSKVAGLVIVGF